MLSAYTTLAFLTSFFVPSIKLTPIPAQYSAVLPIYLGFVLTFAVLFNGIAAVLKE
ncbi:hypothetical protein HZA97_07665 [Candidatus Woesearchaeota archaeon]|nr:hypothetical protein [Candidatus Woesearchaeota archaeon]